MSFQPYKSIRLWAITEKEIEGDSKKEKDTHIHTHTHTHTHTHPPCSFFFLSLTISGIISIIINISVEIFHITFLLNFGTE